MRTIEFTAEPTSLSFSQLKRILQCADFQPSTTRERLAARFIFPLDDAVAPQPEKVSLSDRAKFSDQIRFFLIERSRRHYRLFASIIEGQFGETVVNVRNWEFLDEGSRDFISVVTHSAFNIHFNLVEPRECASNETDRYAPTADEHQLQLLISRRSDLSSDELAYLWSAAGRYLNVGDGWTCIKCCTRLLAEDSDQLRTADLYRMLGMSYLLVGDTTSSEVHNRLWKSCGGAEVPKANYALAMLYARHHPPHLRNLNTAELLLEEAYSLLIQSRIASGTDVFQEVFNRNGLALIEYKRGDVVKAGKRVQEGIERLDAAHGRAALHRVVLQYNFALCYQALGQLENAEREFLRLLKDDPLMSDYHLELTRVRLADGHFLDALSSIDTALELDEYISEGHSLRGLVLLRLDRQTEALVAYTRATKLDSRSTTYAYDLAWLLNEEGRQNEALEVLESTARVNHVGILTPDYWSLLAETRSFDRGLGACLETLETALQFDLTQQLLLDNLAEVRAAIASPEGYRET